MESYAHKMAKQVVLGWLRETARQTGADRYTSDPLGIGWRVNRGAPLWGVYEECPILADGTGLLPCWDETVGELGDAPPTYQQLVAAGSPPVAILDIAVQHKGQVVCGIEIVHKNPPSDRKLRLLRAMEDRPTLLVLPAKWVLGQVAAPKPPIPQEFWVWG